MILKNKKLLLITSVLTLLPIPLGLLLWNRFPETMAIHFGITGQADGFASVPFAVFVPPVLMLAVQWLCTLATALDRRNRDRNQKMFRIVLWTIPIISNLCCLDMYALALGWEFSPVAWTMVPMGLLFALIGNYMPKTKRNSTMGIKVIWTYTSEANWNATHRFAGKLWVIGGLLIALGGLLPNGWAVAVMIVAIVFLCVVPMVYSYRFYKQEYAAGKVEKAGLSAGDKKTTTVTVVFLILLTAFALTVLFYGDIDFRFQEDYLSIEPNMYTDYILRYDVIDDLEYREENVPGLRVGGYGSFRLLLGFFENEEFGTYIRYTYYKPEACVVVETGKQTIVLSGKDAAQTREVYEMLLEKVR